MRLTRVYVDAALQPGQRLTLPEAASGHVLRVLRLREGDACVLFNGDGHDYDAQIVHADKRGGAVEIGSARVVHSESPLSLWLVQGIARGEKMDLIVQKATELGVCGIIPVISERSEVKLNAERAEKRLGHWRQVMQSACEQSGRARLPALHPPILLAQCAPALPQTSARCWLDPEASQSLRSIDIATGTALALAVGPEGGWSPRDLQILVGLGFTGLRLGPRILRTETAGLAAIAVMQMRWGDFG